MQCIDVERRLDEINLEALTRVERLEHRMLTAHLQGRMFELEAVRTWERNPQFYSDLLATSLAGQTLFAHASAPERARRVLSKLRQTPRVIQAARENIKDPPGIYVKVGIETMRGALKFIDEDLPRAFKDVDDLHLLGDLADASTEAWNSVSSYVEFLETDLAPRSKGSFRLGRERFEQKFSLDEGLTIGADKLLAIATRELHKTQEEFRRVASRVNGGDPVAAWQKAKADHPPAGQLVAVAEEQLAELADFIRRQRIVTLPEGAPVAVRPTPKFYRWTAASMWTPGPFESKPVRAFYYITDVDPSWPPARQDEHLRDFSYGALWSISIHEVFPGHFLHYQRLRQVESTLRKSILFSSSAFVEGWAHYCEQMMIDEGFRKNDTGVRLGQLAESLIRLCRCIVGIRLHCEDMSVEQAVRFFREEAFLEEPTARREAERGTFDPSYILYSAGKLMLLKLREDYKAHVGAKYTLRDFHDTLLGNGTVPIWLHRALMLGPQNGEAID